MKVRGEGEWHARKHGGARRRVWRKVHLAVDEGEEDQETVRGTVSPTNLEVRAVEFTDSGVDDAPMLPGLLSQIPQGEPIASVTADGAYDGRACRDVVASRGADAVIPPRRNAKPWVKDSPGAFAMVLEPMATHGSPRNEALRAIGRVGRTIWRRWSGYHRRSRVETKPLGTLLRNALPANG